MNLFFLYIIFRAYHVAGTMLTKYTGLPSEAGIGHTQDIAVA